MACSAIDHRALYETFKARQELFMVAGNVATNSGDQEVANVCWEYAARMETRAREARKALRHLHGDMLCYETHQREET